MKMSKVGNQTNSQDPQAVNSRVFVGNLNTFQCSKPDVERMFQRYGRLAGISMHKGYAFVQFTNPFDARGACLGEDGRTVLGQTLDVNMVAEPKPHQTGRKRQNMAQTGNDWEYYYDSYYASSAAFAGSRGLVPPPLKRPRLLLSSNGGGGGGGGGGGNNGGAGTRAQTGNGNTNCNTSNNIKHKEKTSSPPPQAKSYSNSDILICGNCREMFSDLQELMEHKKEFCKLRFTCKCSSLNDIEESVSLTCAQCKERFNSAWDLMVHVQAAHMLNIYELSAKSTDDRLSPSPNSNTSNCIQKDVEEMETGDAEKENGSDEDTHSETTESCIVGALSIEPNVGGGIGAQLEIQTITNGGSIKASE